MTDAVAINITPPAQNDGEEAKNPEEEEEEVVGEEEEEEEEKDVPPEMLTVEHMRICKHAFERLCKEW